MVSLTKFVSCNGRVLWGWWFLIVGAVSFMGFLYAAVISKLQPPSHNVIIRAVQNDWYFIKLFRIGTLSPAQLWSLSSSTWAIASSCRIERKMSIIASWCR